MRTLILASNNNHKFEEMRGILAHLNAEITLLRPHDLGFTFDVEEHGTTFGENAAAKAGGLYMLMKGILNRGVSASEQPEEIGDRLRKRFGDVLPAVIADDSGICVHALNNAPGVYSARFGADTPDPPTDDEGRNRYLLKVLADTDERGAHYVCNAVLVRDAEQYVQAEATWHGSVLRRPIFGETGFGYDPLIYLEPYKTSVARIPQAQKNLISHRAKAVGAVVAAVGLAGHPFS